MDFGYGKKIYWGKYMGSYFPDKWVMVEIKYQNEINYKVYAGWYGGFALGDSWKLSSGVTYYTFLENKYHFFNVSGSEYVCDKLKYGLTFYMESVLNDLKNVVAEEEATIEILDLETALLKIPTH